MTADQPFREETTFQGRHTFIHYLKPDSMRVTRFNVPAAFGNERPAIIR